MIDIIDVMQSVAVFTCAIVGYVLVFQKSGQKKEGHYSLPGEFSMKFELLTCTGLGLLLSEVVCLYGIEDIRLGQRYAMVLKSYLFDKGSKDFIRNFVIVVIPLK